jgi:hypothetical protein
MKNRLTLSTQNIYVLTRFLQQQILQLIPAPPKKQLFSRIESQCIRSDGINLGLQGIEQLSIGLEANLLHSFYQYNNHIMPKTFGFKIRMPFIFKYFDHLAR